ncbi:MAG TPA: protein kinase [Candidatus Acidoferrales bacterium]|nr:protein kinase [Candidatus Acidoferrales bacterium]
MKDTTIAHYKVLHELGRGGMGVVCKAHDLRLGRDVALKFLPPSLTMNARSRERLISEARAVSKLDHPNVCTVHEIEETEDGQVVIVMAYYDGETLADRLRRGRLDLHEAINVTRSVLLGLEHAHERGVIHRDIKPSNIILCGNSGVKIVDFGLARLTGADDTLTQDVVGTLAYLEPETVVGQAADHRTDLWSCGVVLYEMLAGVQPFEGESVAALLGAISRNNPRPLQQLRPELPARVHEIVSRALGKYRATRYQSAGDFIADLQHFIHTGTGGSVSVPVAVPHQEEHGEKSLVVLPFVAVGGSAETDYFSDGLTDEIITDLSGIHRLRVICRTSAMKLKGTQKDAKEIASDLDVKYVLEGTVRISGQQLRVNAKLVDSVSDSPLWADKFSGSLEDVFSIQEEVSRRIVQALKVKLTRDESQRLREHPIEDIRAYEYYLRARRELLAYSRPALENALEYISKGEQLIGENILLLSARGYVHWQFMNAGVDPDPVHLRIASECAKRILELQSDSPHGVRLLGLVAVLEGRTQEAVHYLKKSLELAPNDPDSMAWLCAICALSGKGHEVAAMASRLVEIDPLTPTYHFVPGLVALLSGDLEGAIPPFEQTLAGDPENQMLRFCLGQALLMNSRFEEAVAIFEKLGSEMPGDFFAQLGLVLRYGLARDVNKLRAALTEEVAATAAGDMNYAWVVAQGWALASQTQEALHWLGQAVDHGFINYPLLRRLDPTLQSIRHDPDFAALLEKTRKRWEAFKV